MKVTRDEFNKAISLLAVINFEELDILDLSEFYDVESGEYKKLLEEWKFTGLSNVEFIKFNDWK
jgi:hypothetical protein